MSGQSNRIASQLKEFIKSGHVYTDELDDELIERIREAADKEPEETVPFGVSKRKGKARRSIVPRFPSEWASSREAFQKAVRKFEYENYAEIPEKLSTAGPSRFKSASPIIIKQDMSAGTYTPGDRFLAPENRVTTEKKTFSLSIIPREVMALFNGFERLEENNWNIWKGHMQDNLEICDLWDIVNGQEKKPQNIYKNEAESWDTRERIARVIIKNALGPSSYQQVCFAKTAADIWKALTSLHQSTGAQAKVEMIWNFWSKRCAEGAPVREHIGNVRALHMELAENGIIIDGYLLAILMSKSLPPSYDSFVSTIFAGINDLEQADPNYVVSKIFEEEMRRESKNEDAHVAVQRNCLNCKKPGHLEEQCYAKGGGREGQAPWQIAKKKKEESERKKGVNAQMAEQEQDVFFLVTWH